MFINGGGEDNEELGIFSINNLPQSFNPTALLN